MLDRKRLAFGAVYGLVLVVVTLVGIELLASFFVPAWPARALIAREPGSMRMLSAPFARQPWLADADNSWGMRDRERSLAKPAGTYRALFIGDSFVESRFTPLTLPAAVMQRLDPSERRIEGVNLGVSATDPRSYYFRIRDVALDLQPDALLVFIYAGNDFMLPGDGYTPWPRLVDQSPGASIVGSLMPRTNWLLVNRLGLADFFKSRTKAPPNDETLIYQAITAPAPERLQRLVSYVKTYTAPEVPEAKIAEILSRGDRRFLDIALPHEGGEQEYLMDWMLSILMSWEAGTFDVPANRQDTARVANQGHVEATFSWIKAMDRLAHERHVPLLLFLVPIGGIDPDYAAFWQPWSRAYAWNWICDEWQSRLAAALSREGIRFVDLREDLDGVPGTYRKLDGHWSQKGLAIVADRVARELKNPPSE
jgi:hypothetical protein